MIEIGFLTIGFWDILDILLVGILFYQLYKMLRGSLAFTIFIGLMVVYLMALIVEALEMNMLASILGQFVGTGFILLAIVFQQEIRRFLFYIGSGSGIGTAKFWQRFTRANVQSEPELQRIRDELTRAIQNLAATKTGCLIVFVKPREERFFAGTGVPIGGVITSKLIESIFDKQSPLHDGALIISNHKILSAGCVLPVSESNNIPARVGMRHRAAVGITEQTDAHSIIVSEERGKISYAHKSKLKMNITQNMLSEILADVISVRE